MEKRKLTGKRNVTMNELKENMIGNAQSWAEWKLHKHWTTMRAYTSSIENNKNAVCFKGIVYSKITIL